MTDRAVPYPGLRPFEEKDRAIFFGREAQMVSVLALLEEKQFVAVVGSSGSGKSSLILAGVIPAVREGFLRGTSEWKIVTLKPGSDPCGNLARALEREGIGQSHEDPPPKSAVRADPATLPLAEDGPQTLIEKLHATDRSLIDFVAPPSQSGPIAGDGSKERDELPRSVAVTFARPEELSGPRMLIVVDQFEELFSFRRVEAETISNTERFATRDEAATFVRLLLCACAAPGGRIAVIITMRSDFIGDCDAFLELPELVSRCQFLVPRLNRSQLREAIERPGQVEDLGYAPFVFEEGLVNRLLADAGDRLDQLPLMQHALMRTWKEAGGPEASLANSLTLTDQHYETAGRITGALSKHADLAWFAIKDDEIKAQFTRQLFLLLCDVHPDGKIVRRRPTLSEIQEITGADVPAIEEIVRLFQSDDRNFLLPPLEEGVHLKAGDHLDISHEALLRQWTEFGKWLVDEAEWKVWLQELSQAAKDLEENPETERWHGNDLRGAEEWIQKAQPSEAWARRHGVRNWDKCLAFLEQSRSEAIKEEEELEAEAQQARVEKARQALEAAEAEKEAYESRERERRQRTLLRFIAFIAGMFLILGMAMIYLWYSAKKSADEARTAAADRLRVIQTLVEAAGPSISDGTAALAEVEHQRAVLIAEIRKAATEAPPPGLTEGGLQRAENEADIAINAMEKMAGAIEEVARMTGDEGRKRVAESLRKEAFHARERRKALHRDAATLEIVKTSIETRLAHAENSLARVEDGGTFKKSLSFNKIIIRVHLQIIEVIQKAAVPLGFEGYDYQPFSERIAAIDRALAAKETANTSGPIAAWNPGNALAPLALSGRVNRVRFAPNVPAGGPLLAAACGGDQVWFWQKGGRSRGIGTTSDHAINDVSFSPRGDALAAASDGGTVRLLRWPNAGTLESFDQAYLKIQAFERHSNSITDVEFSHGGERIASASVDRTVRVFDSRSLAQLYFTSPPLPDSVTSVAFHRGDNLVVSGCDDGGVRLHTIDRPAVQVLGKFDLAARSPEFSYDGKLVVAASPDKTARVWPISRPREIIRVNHPAIVTQATFRPVVDAEGYTFITTAANGEVRLVEFTDISSASLDHPAKILEPRHVGAAVSATWSADGRWLATVGEGEVIVWEWVSDAPIARLRIAELNSATSRAEFSPDAQLLVTYGGDQIVYVWDLSKLTAQTYE